MGYEFELLRNLAADLGVQLHLIIESDLEKAFRLLNKGQADIVAINLEINEERLQYANFTLPTRQIGTLLLQKKSRNKIESFHDLEGKTVHVRKGAIHKQYLDTIKDSLELNMEIMEVELDQESLIQQVIQDEITLTVTDSDLALVNATYYDEIDVSMVISEASPVGWAVRTNAPRLLDAINEWIEQKNESSYIDILFQKYFLNKKNSYFRSNSAFSSISGNRISEFDDLIRRGAEELGWDWRLLASLVYKESRFDTAATSYAGAVGLLQLMPVTLERFGVENPNDPYESLLGGVNFLKYLDRFWRERVPETNDRIHFILASYNVGHGHVEDAWRLALKFGKNPQSWENVAYFLERKSQPEFYRDPVVKNGYAKGKVAVNYVRDVVNLYESYRVLVQP